MSFQFEWDGLVISILQEWNDHSIPAGMEWSYSNPAGMEWSFHSGRNEMLIPFLLEWNDSISFWQEWSGHSIPAGLE